MNSNHNHNTLTPEHLDRLAPCKEIICALQHGQYADTARKVSALSKQRRQIVGGLIDDFREPTGPSKAITPQETKAIYDALKSENPALRLYLVRYTWQDQKELLPFLPYFDCINLWVWVADEKPWRETIDAEIDRIKALTHKPILLGLFVHDYGGTGKAVSMNVLELQTKKAVELARQGKIEGFVFLQSGWFQHEDHRPQVQWIKQHLDSILPNSNQLTEAEKAAGWKLLFDGKTSAGWRNFRKQTVSQGWQVIDGALCRVDKSAGDIITVDQYDNFVLELDYKVPPHANSGIMVRVSEDRERAPQTGVEYQILDNTDPRGDPQKAGWAYALYQPPPDPKTGKPLDAAKPVGQWNRVKLVCRGPHVEHWMNGVKYLEYEIGSDDFKQRIAASKFAKWPGFAQYTTGHIALQGDHGDVCFANIKLLPLKVK
jgi:hypothetical protein